VLRDGAVSGRAAVAEVTREGLARNDGGTRPLGSGDAQHQRAGDPVLTVEGLSPATSRVPRGSMASASPFEPARFSRLRGRRQWPGRPARYAGWHPARSWRAHRARRARHHPHERAAASGCGTCLHSGRSRHTGLVLGMSITDNLAMRRFRRAPLSRGPLLRLAPCAPPRANGSGPSTSAPPMSMCRPHAIRRQPAEVVLAREIGRRPRMLMAFQADLGARSRRDAFCDRPDAGTARCRLRLLYVSVRA